MINAESNAWPKRREKDNGAPSPKWDSDIARSKAQVTALKERQKECKTKG